MLQGKKSINMQSERVPQHDLSARIVLRKAEAWMARIRVQGLKTRTRFNWQAAYVHQLSFSLHSH